MLNYIINLYYARCRRIDVKVLWPVLREAAETIEQARSAFLIHVGFDKDWLVLGADKMIETIENLH